jgi:magnesium-transporting ATPase (P-type)
LLTDKTGTLTEGWLSFAAALDACPHTKYALTLESRKVFGSPLLVSGLAFQHSAKPGT